MTGSALGDAALLGLLGLLLGSFLNVVIHRLPKMMERQWAAECAQYAQDAGQRGIGPQRAKHQTTWPSLKIGRYMETTMPPMSVPRKTMMMGSIRLDRPATISSTSAS